MSTESITPISAGHSGYLSLISLSLMLQGKLLIGDSRSGETSTFLRATSVGRCTKGQISIHVSKCIKEYIV